MQAFATERLVIERKQWRQHHPFGFIALPARHKRGGLDLKHWDCYIPGLANTPWEGGLYKLVVTFPDCYPAQPPKCRFVAPLFHPNVEKGGLLCMSGLSADGWKPSTSLRELLVQIQWFLGEPDMNYFVNTEAWRMAETEPMRYACCVRRQALEFAEWRVHEELQRGGQ